MATTTIAEEPSSRTEMSEEVDDCEWLRRMTALYNCLTRHEIESLIAWEHDQITKTGFMRTADWPGWESRIGRRPHRSE